ncbi:MAG: prepilin-type N-terminal cleavage/methylation domain-containing protein [Betaproteobacteria bacterium]
MRSRQHGFSLIEIAIVMFVIVLLVGSVLAPLAAQIDQRHVSDTQKYLDEIREALTGYAAANGRLPCPASPGSAGVEDPSGGGTCAINYNGFIPAVTLGISVVDSQGFAVDPWGNRIHYAVTNSNGNAFTTANGMSTATLSALAPNLLICSTATGISASSCAAGTALTTGVPAIIYSIGKNGGYGGTGVDEAANPNPNSANNDRVFVSHVPTPASAPNGEFDDIMTWVSANVLYNRMISAGRLP